MRLHEVALGLVVEQEEQVGAEVLLFEQSLHMELGNVRPVGILC